MEVIRTNVKVAIFFIFFGGCKKQERERERERGTREGEGLMMRNREDRGIRGTRQNVT